MKYVDFVPLQRVSKQVTEQRRGKDYIKYNECNYVLLLHIQTISYKTL